jgi:nicotinamide-nucleotide amidase
VGDEVLAGRTSDANGAWLARRLFEEGALLGEVRTVPDRPEAVAEALSALAARADLVVVSGGLGPTADDRTRDGLALLLRTDLARDAAAAEMVHATLRRRGRTPVPAQGVQAMLPRGAGPLENPVGTAPGIRLEHGGAVIVALPGVPSEFHAMVEAHVLPWVRAHPGAEAAAVRSLWVAGLPEADAGALVRDLMESPEPVVGSYPAEGEVELRVVARGDAAAGRAEAVVAEMARRLGDHAVGPLALAPTLVGLLASAGKRLAAAESVTGGLLAALLTDVPGASAVFAGSLVVYTDDAKRALLGVDARLLADHGAVSAEAAAAMAEGALARLSADLALALTGSAGPDAAPGPRGPVPPGVVHVALAERGARPEVRTLSLGGLPRAVVRRRSALAALDLARRALLRRRG